MKTHRAFWVIAGVSVALAVGAYGVRGMLGDVLSRSDERMKRDSLVAELIAALDFDPRLRQARTQRLVERVSGYCGDASLATAESCYALGLREYYGEYDTAGARAAFERARELRPEWAWPVNGLAIVEYATGQRDSAMRLFGEALQMEPGWSRPHADMAILLRRSGQVAEALDHARAALEIEPSHPINHYNYGVILDGLGRHAEAREEYLKTISIAPDLPQALYNLACSFGREGNIDEALGPLARAIALEPEFMEDASTDPDFGLIRDDPRFVRVATGSGEAP